MKEPNIVTIKKKVVFEGLAKIVIADTKAEAQRLFEDFSNPILATVEYNGKNKGIWNWEIGENNYPNNTKISVSGKKNDFTVKYTAQFDCEIYVEADTTKEAKTILANSGLKILPTNTNSLPRFIKNWQVKAK